MAHAITTSLTYSKEDAQRYFFSPLFIKDPELESFDTLFDVQGSFKLDKFSSLEKITKAEATGFSGSTGATYTQRSIAVSRVEAEVSQAGGTFYNTVKGELLRRGLNKDDITGTVLQDIVAELFLRGMKRDMKRQLWLGNSSLSAKPDYDIYDGIFENYTNLPAGQQLSIAASGGDINVMTGAALNAGAASDIFEALYEAAPAELIEMQGEAVIEVSGSIADNWITENETKATDMAHGFLLDGLGNSLKWRGVAVRVHRDWDTHIAADSADLGITNPHRAVMHVPKNVCVGTDINQVGSFDMWYNKDEKENRFRGEYVIGTNYKNDELAVTAITA